MPPLPEDPRSLIGDDDRDAAVRRLQDAYAEGHISHKEMDERLHRQDTYTTRRRSRPGGPTIRISGAMGLGRLKIRHARR